MPANAVLCDGWPVPLRRLSVIWQYTRRHALCGIGLAGSIADRLRLTDKQRPYLIIVWVFTLTALRRTKLKVRSASAALLCALGMFFASPAKTDLAAHSASVASLLPRPRRRERSGRLISMSWTPLTTGLKHVHQSCTVRACAFKARAAQQLKCLSPAEQLFVPVVMGPVHGQPCP